MTRAAFEEALRLYPPAPSINRAAIADDRFGDVEIKAGVTVLVMPWNPAAVLQIPIIGKTALDPKKNVPRCSTFGGVG